MLPNTLLIFLYQYIANFGYSTNYFSSVFELVVQIKMAP